MMTAEGSHDSVSLNSATPIRLPDPEPGDGAAAQYLAADFHCLVHVDHFETGGVRDTIAQVIARWREVFRQVTIEVPRPKKGVRELPYVCPMCGKPVVFLAKSWLRTNLVPLCGVILLGVVLGIVGWFNVEAHGMVGIGIAVAGLFIAVVIPILTMMVPGLLDSLPSALRITKDVSRDPSMFPIPGAEHPETTDYHELAGGGRNQHKLEKVRIAR